MVHSHRVAFSSAISWETASEFPDVAPGCFVRTGSDSTFFERPDRAGRLTRVCFLVDLYIACSTFAAPPRTSITVKRINFRAGAEMTEMMKAIATTAEHASTSDVIRTAVAVAYLSWCEYGNKLVLKHRDGRQIGLGFPEPSKFDTKLDQIIQVRSDGALSKYLHALAESGFAGSVTEIIRRSLGLYRSLLQCREEGWDCGYMTEAGDFTIIPILSFIRPHRLSPLIRKDLPK